MPRIKKSITTRVSLVDKIKGTKNNFNSRIKQKSTRVVPFIKNNPVKAFFIALALLFLLIVLGNTVFKAPQPNLTKQATVKEVEVVNIGQVPKITVQAQVQKDGVIQIVSQAAGVVQETPVKEGDLVNSGTTLVSLSSNYQGGNAATIQRQLAGSQLQAVSDTYNTQKETIGKQKQLAREGYKNTQELLQIAVLSLNDNNELMNLNSTIINTIQANLLQLQNNNFNNQNASLILATQQQLSSIQSAQAQLGIQARNLGQQIDPANAPKSINELNRDIALKQLDVQERNLELTRQTAALQFKLAQVQESLMFPVSPCEATIQKVHVAFGQSVSPGTTLVTLYCPKGNISVDAKVPSQVAMSVSTLEQSIIHIDDQTFSTYPRFVSTQATSGQLYSIIFDIPDTYQKSLTDNSFVSVDIPLGDTDSNSVIPFVPLDAVFQTQEQAFVYILDGDTASSRIVNLGPVVGGEVEVTQGLKDGDRVILDRDVIAGDKVKVN
jgi:multidrug efflux pump subunit AcrA (membrane-fusion protein)